MSRYLAQGIEAQFEPGSRRRVLRNLLSIRSSRAMSRVESEALLQAQRRLVDTFSRDHRFTANDIRKMHQVWLGHIYSWAGEYGGYFRRCDSPLFATICPLTLGRVIVRLENGLRIPSTAEDVLADIQRPSSRNAGSRKY